MTVRVIKVKFQKRCAWCEDFVLVDSQACYNEETKELWHLDCRPPQSVLDEQHKLAERLGFKDAATPDGVREERDG